MAYRGVMYSIDLDGQFVALIVCQEPRIQEFESINETFQEG